MSTLLPLFLSPQNGPGSTTSPEVAVELSGEGVQGQSPSSNQPAAKPFSQVLNELGGASVLLQDRQTVEKTESLTEALGIGPLVQKDVRHSDVLEEPEIVEKIVAKLHPTKIQEPLSEPLPSTADSTLLLEPFRLVSAPVVPQPTVGRTESVPSQNHGLALEQETSPVGVLTIPTAQLQEFQLLPRPVFQDNGSPRYGEEFSLRPAKLPGFVVNNIGTGQIPITRTLEAGPIPSHQGVAEKIGESSAITQEFSPGHDGKVVSSGLKIEETLSERTIGPLAQKVQSGLPQLERPIIGNDSQTKGILPEIASRLAQPQQVKLNPIPLATAVQAEGPVGFMGPDVTKQIAGKSGPSTVSVLSDLNGQSIEHRTVVPADVSGETGVLIKGERGQVGVETLLRNVAVDSTGGQGLGNGMNHFSNSSSGHQQQSMLAGQGPGARALEERGQEFPAPVLQRLQMDVQVSENQRVQIDVGVQNRLVSAGLVMDHSALRNLANQFVPHLENQLSQVDLELEEFSAEVREESEPETHSMFDDSRTSKGQQLGRQTQGELQTTPNPLGHRKEAGLHFVA